MYVASRDLDHASDREPRHGRISHMSVLALPAIVRLVPDHVEDSELAARVAAGDTDALRELYDRYATVLFGMAYRMLGDRQLAEDCVQDVFVTVWRSAGRYDAKRAAVTTWLFTIVRNKAVDALRRRTRRRADPLPEQWSGGESPDAADIAATAERSESVAAALAELPPPQLEALSLAYFDGLSHAEIAARLDVPIGTVKGRIRLALERLRTLAPKYALQTETGR